MNTTSLLVLGALHLEGPCHGYAVQQRLLAWNTAPWARVLPGSVYHALKRLVAEGAAQTEPSPTPSRGPSRTTYAVTEAGRHTLEAQCSEALTSVEPSELAAGVALMQVLTRERAVDQLARCQRTLRQYSEQLEALKPRTRGAGIEPHTDDLLALWQSHSRATAVWVDDLITRIRSGEYHFADEPGAVPSGSAPVARGPTHHHPRLPSAHSEPEPPAPSPPDQ